MLIKPGIQSIRIIVPLLSVSFIVLFIYYYGDASIVRIKQWSSKECDCTVVPGSPHQEPAKDAAPKDEPEIQVDPHYLAPESYFGPPGSHEPDFPVSAEDEDEPLVDETFYRKIYSTSTSNKKYFDVRMGRFPAYNPNIIPHPSNEDQWIVVAQHEKSASKDPVFAQLVCNAAFSNNELACIDVPSIAPYAGTNRSPKEMKAGRKCGPKYNFLNYNVGPHDARVFWGPDAPYTIFGSNSHIICFGQWVQDFRRLFGSWGLDGQPAVFEDETELRRPDPQRPDPSKNGSLIVEKNWFMFWDMQGKAYVHHDIAPPPRVFAEVRPDGKPGPNLAPKAATNDNKCMARYMPKPAKDLEGVHQATNSLSVTMCKRGECTPNDDNTFVVTIIHLKTFYDWHGQYEPYVVVFRQRAPFELYAVSEKALWINGRAYWNGKAAAKVHKWKPVPAKDLVKGHAEMVYVTSMTWKAHGQRYHGYLDDIMFLGIGIEDARPGAIDIYASDLLQDLGLCDVT